MAKVRRAEGSSQGAGLLRAVERIVESPSRIRGKVAAEAEKIRASLPADATPAQRRQALERRLISEYSYKTALAGGAAALPSVMPGLGTFASALGGGLLDMTACLKLEVELALALASARGHDIEDPRERQLAYLLAAVHGSEGSAAGSALADLVKAEADAIWHYTPRQLGKLVSAAFVRLAIQLAGRGLTRAIPIVGVVVSSAANKALTARVGRGVVEALDEREHRAGGGEAPPSRRRPKSAERPASPRAAGGRR
jgi:hypothetical protein